MSTSRAANYLIDLLDSGTNSRFEYSGADGRGAGHILVD